MWYTLDSTQILHETGFLEKEKRLSGHLSPESGHLFSNTWEVLLNRVAHIDELVDHWSQQDIVRSSRWSIGQCSHSTHCARRRTPLEYGHSTEGLWVLFSVVDNPVLGRCLRWYPEEDALDDTAEVERRVQSGLCKIPVDDCSALRASEWSHNGSMLRTMTTEIWPHQLPHRGKTTCDSWDGRGHRIEDVLCGPVLCSTRRHATTLSTVCYPPTADEQPRSSICPVTIMPLTRAQYASRGFSKKLCQTDQSSFSEWTRWDSYRLTAANIRDVHERMGFLHWAHCRSTTVWKGDLGMF